MMHQEVHYQLTESLLEPIKVGTMNVQFVNETEDLVNGSTCWDGMREESGDSDDACHSPSGRIACIESGPAADVQNGRRCPLPGKKTRGRVKIKMEYIKNKVRRYTTFSKRKTGIMKKAYELSALTGTQVMLLVASETGHVYTFATRKLQPMITSENGKALIQTCLNSPDTLISAQRELDGVGLILAAAGSNADSTDSATVSNGIHENTAPPPAQVGEMTQQLTQQPPAVVGGDGVVKFQTDLGRQILVASSVPSPELMLNRPTGVDAKSRSDVDSSSLMMMSEAHCGEQEQVRQVVTLPGAMALGDQTQNMQIYCQVPGTNQLISLQVGSSNPQLAAGVGGQSLICPPGFVFASPANGLPAENYVLSLPNTPAFNHGGNSAAPQFFTIPMSAASAQVFQPLLTSSSAEVDSLQAGIKKDIT